LLWPSRDASKWATRSSKCSLMPEDDIDDSLSCVGAERTVRGGCGGQLVVSG